MTSPEISVRRAPARESFVEGHGFSLADKARMLTNAPMRRDRFCFLRLRETRGQTGRFPKISVPFRLIWWKLRRALFVTQAFEPCLSLRGNPD